MPLYKRCQEYYIISGNARVQGWKVKKEGGVGREATQLGFLRATASCASCFVCWRPVLRVSSAVVN